MDTVNITVNEIATSSSSTGTGEVNDPGTPPVTAESTFSLSNDETEGSI